MEHEFEKIDIASDSKQHHDEECTTLNMDYLLSNAFNRIEDVDEKRDFLTPKAYENLRAIFDYFDKKGNGKLTQRMWDIYQTGSMGTTFNSDELPDVDEPEIYTFEDFVKDYKDKARSTHNLKDSLISGISKAFDADNTGFINTNEFAKISIDDPERFICTTQEEIGWMSKFTQVDGDKFNYVQFIENIARYEE